jgi:hypothetical protein
VNRPYSEATPKPVHFGRRNVHCSNCGDERGGPFGHEISECLYRPGMTVTELAATMPADKASRYLDAAIDAYFERELGEVSRERT